MKFLPGGEFWEKLSHQLPGDGLVRRSSPTNQLYTNTITYTVLALDFFFRNDPRDFIAELSYMLLYYIVQFIAELSYMLLYYIVQVLRCIYKM